jgi:hypothetical protein
MLDTRNDLMKIALTHAIVRGHRDYVAWILETGMPLDNDVRYWLADLIARPDRAARRTATARWWRQQLSAEVLRLRASGYEKQDAAIREVMQRRLVSEATVRRALKRR